jgi:hypothetical protein
MWAIQLALSLAALYAAIIAGMYFIQTWFLFPTFLARATRVRLPESARRLKVTTPDGESLVGCPSSDDLRRFACFRKGGSGSSVVEIMRHAVDAASDDLRWSGV